MKDLLSNTYLKPPHNLPIERETPYETVEN